MGLLDFIRRRFEDSPPPADVASGAAESDAAEATPSEPVASEPIASEPGPVADTTEAPSGASNGPTSPPAWSMLPVIRTVSSPTIARSFDVEIGQRLRAHRSADQLLASHSLGHTVNPSSIGVVGGLAQVVSRSSAVPTHAATGDQVLRRRVLRRTELAEADHAHPRWPVLARSFQASSESSVGHSPVAPSNPSAASGDWEPSTQSALVERSVAPSDGDATLSADELTAGGPVAGPERTLPLAPPLGLVAPIRRLTEGHASSLSASIARAVASPVDAGRASLPTALTLRATDSPGTVGTEPLSQSVPLAPLGGPGLSQTTAFTPSANPAPTIARSADLQAVARTLRRRSIVEMPSSSGPPSSVPSSGGPSVAGPSTPASPIVDRSSDPSGENPPFAPGTSEGVEASAPRLVARSADDDGSADGSSDAQATSSTSAGASPSAVPTLGRRVGVGAPLSALPPTAVARTAPDDDDGPRPPWERSSTADLPLGPGAAVGASTRSLTGSGPLTGSGASTGSSLQRSPEPDRTGASSSGPSSGPSAGTSPFMTTNSGVVLPTLTVLSRMPADSSSHAVGPAADVISFDDPTGVSGTGSPDHGDGSRPLLGDNGSMVGADGGTPIGVIPTPEDIAPSPTSALPVLRAVDPSPASPFLSSPSRSHFAASSTDSISASVGRQTEVLHRSVAPSSTDRSSNSGPGSGPTGGSTPTVMRTLAPAGTNRSAATDTARSGERAQLADSASIADHAGKDIMQRLTSTPNTLTIARTAESASMPLVLRSPSSPSPATSGAAAFGGPSSNAAGAGAGTGAGGSDGGAAFTWTTDAYDLLQREADGDGGGAPPPSAPPPAADTAGAASAAAGAPAGGSSTQSEADLELLAGRLYERLRSRIRRELLDDRERAGLVLDRVR